MPFRVTRQGYERMRQELERLYRRRKELVEEIRATASEGDLSENAGYEAAKRALAMVDAQIQRLKERLANVEIIERVGKPEWVEVGTIVTLQDIETGAKHHYRIAESIEINLSDPIKTATPRSPLGVALMGKKVGDEVTLQFRTRLQHFKIIALNWDGADAEGQEEFSEEGSGGKEPSP